MILIGKNLVSPKYVSDKEWIELGLIPDMKKFGARDVDGNQLLNLKNDMKKMKETKIFKQWQDDVALFLESVNENLVAGGQDGPCKKTLFTLKTQEYS